MAIDDPTAILGELGLEKPRGALAPGDILARERGSQERERQTETKASDDGGEIQANHCSLLR